MSAASNVPAGAKKIGYIGVVVLALALIYQYQGWGLIDIGLPAKTENTIGTYYKVTKVVDGDTIHIDMNGTDEKVRFGDRDCDAVEISAIILKHLKAMGEKSGGQPLDNVVVTPHAAGVDLQSRDDMALSAAVSILALSRGEWPTEQVVNPEVRDRFRW